MTTASVRAGWTQHLLRSARALPAPRVAQLEAAIPSATLAAVDGAGSMTWLPLSEHMGVLRGLRSSLGAARYRTFSCSAVRAALAHPLLFAKQAALALDVFSASRWTMYKIIPVGIRQIFRDLGSVTVTVSNDDRRAVVVYKDFPSVFSAGDVWSLIWLGTLDALAAHTFEQRGQRAEVLQVRHVPEEGSYEWAARVMGASAARSSVAG